MRTYSHGVIGYLLYARRPRRERMLAALGGMLPDTLLVVGFIPHYLEQVTSLPMVAEWHRLLHFSSLHTVTVFLHSFLVVGLLLVASLIFYKPMLPLWVGMLAHGVVDLLTHQQWAYNHFFPIPITPMRAMISYTEVGFAIVEHALLLLCIAWWVARRKRR